MSLTEVLGVATGAACVLLAIREIVWTWPVGLANNIFFFVLFWRAKLYADSSLQVVYMAISLYGWWNWLYGGKNHRPLQVHHASLSGLAGYGLIALCSTAILYWLLRRFTPSTVPLADGLTTALFLTAQYMMSRKLVENWWFWIVGDVLVIGLYIYKHLYFTTLLYMLFLGLCVAGLVEWRKSAQQQPRLAAGA
jgi:nicotinamide mononucleotide transporter